MSQPNGLLILGDHLLNYIFFGGQRGLINTAGIINPNLTLAIIVSLPDSNSLIFRFPSGTRTSFDWVSSGWSPRSSSWIRQLVTLVMVRSYTHHYPLTGGGIPKWFQHECNDDNGVTISSFGCPSMQSNMSFKRAEIGNHDRPWDMGLGTLFSDKLMS